MAAGIRLRTDRAPVARTRPLADAADLPRRVSARRVPRRRAHPTARGSSRARPSIAGTCGAATAASGCSSRHRRRTCDRWTSDSYFLGAIASARKLLPTADVHVFSSTEGAAARADQAVERVPAGGRDGPPGRGERARRGRIWWAPPSSSLSRSSFSVLAGIVNPGCVVY